MIYTDGVHLISSESLDELHNFAVNKLKFKKSWFQWHTRYPHYDLTTSSAKKRAVNEGAILITGTELVKILQAIPYMREFWIESVEEYLKDLRIWIKQNNLNCGVDDIETGEFGHFLVNGQQYNVEGLFMHRYYKDLGFWRSFNQAKMKKKSLAIN